MKHQASALLMLLACTQALAGPATQVAEDLRAGRIDPAQAAGLWAAAGVDPAQALEQLRELPLVDAPQRDHKAQLVDRFQRTTDLEVRLPKSPAPDGSYRVMLMLHGMNASALQPINFGPSLAPPHTILVAPKAQRIPKGLAFEDMRRLDSPRLRASSRFTHWWSYQRGSFPLLALDYLRERYPIDPNRVWLVGYSMGAFGSWNVGLRYHDRFAGLVAVSGGLSRLEYLPFRDRRSRSLLDNGRMLPAFVVHGTSDRVVPTSFSRRSVDALEARECDVTYQELSGVGHWPFTELHKQHPDMVREWLQEHTRDPHPTKITHHALGAYHGGAYWLRLDALPKNESHAWAEVIADDRIVVTTQDVDRLTVYLDPALVHEGPVTITVDGQDQLVDPQPSLSTVAESYARTKDPELTYTRSVQLDLSGGMPRLLKK